MIPFTRLHVIKILNHILYPCNFFRRYLVLIVVYAGVMFISYMESAIVCELNSIPIHIKPQYIADSLCTLAAKRPYIDMIQVGPLPIVEIEQYRINAVLVLPNNTLHFRCMGLCLPLCLRFLRGIHIIARVLIRVCIRRFYLIIGSGLDRRHMLRSLIALIHF